MRILIVLLFIMSVFSLGAQEEIHPSTDEEAHFPGGPSEMQQFILGESTYPEAAIKKGDQGRVYVRFVVEKNGELNEIEVLRSISPELDKEAIRIVSRMPNWVPGESNGKVVRTRCTVPISFKLGEPSEEKKRKWFNKKK